MAAVTRKIGKKKESPNSSPYHQGASTYHVNPKIAWGVRPLIEFFQYFWGASLIELLTEQLIA